jgi:hypothetical protein
VAFLRSLTKLLTRSAVQCSSNNCRVNELATAFEDAIASVALMGGTYNRLATPV